MNKKSSFLKAMLSIMITASMLSLGSVDTLADNKDDVKIEDETVLYKEEGYLSIRADASSSSEKVGILAKNTSAIKTGKKQGNWIEVESNDIKGWIYEPSIIDSKKDISDYILDNIDDFNVKVQVSKATGQYVNTNNLKYDDFKYSTKVTIPEDNIVFYRSNTLTKYRLDKKGIKEVCLIFEDKAPIFESASSNKVLARVSKDKEFEILNENSSFYKIKYNRGIAYVSKNNSLKKFKQCKLKNKVKVDYVKNTMYDAEVLDNGVVRVNINNKDYYTSIDDVYLFYRADDCSNAVAIANEKEIYNLTGINKKSGIYKITEVSEETDANVDLFMRAEDSNLIVDLDGAIEPLVTFVSKETKSKYLSKYNYEYDNSSTEERNEIINYALKWLGNPYVYGGTSLTEGIDCSAFVQKVLQHSGKTIGRDTATQVSESNGKIIDAEDIQPGDLIYYTRDGKKPYHVVMYLGGDKVVHASCKKFGICIGTVAKDRILMIKNYID